MYSSLKFSAKIYLSLSASGEYVSFINNGNFASFNVVGIIFVSLSYPLKSTNTFSSSTDQIISSRKAIKRLTSHLKLINIVNFDWVLTFKVDRWHIRTFQCGTLLSYWAHKRLKISAKAQ